MDQFFSRCRLPNLMIPTKNKNKSRSSSRAGLSARRHPLATLLALVALLLCLAAQQPAGWLDRPPVGDDGKGVGKPIARRVLALYYPWYATPAVSRRWAHYDGVEPANKRIVSHAHYPAGGPYDSTDPAVIERHLRQAKEAGIDTLVCSWWGRQDTTDRAIRLLIDRAPAHGLTVCIYWERLQPQPDRLAATADLAYLLRTFGSKPGCLRLSGKPVLFLYAGLCRSLPASEWEQALGAAQSRYLAGFIAIGSGDRLADALLWDGLHALDIDGPMQQKDPAAAAALLHERFLPANRLARRLGHIAIETVIAGYDDRKSNATSGIPRRSFVDRADGALYRALWSQAIADQPDWILLDSFNQWHNGTEIEPSAELGDRYLRQTAEQSATFKR
ncbi:MAG TPA: hypothetical protein VKT77_15060 [Chthonomonadaceae bacterium]|nr:hypothetical protein [Chthonomonadaceae bacterium]